MFKYLIPATLIVGVIVIATPTSADWDPGDGHKMHYPQLPDLTPEGMDVLASLALEPMPAPALKVLADDFRCAETGLITDIHIWGSWLNDDVSVEPDHGTFMLAIYDDIPAQTGGVDYSRPGNLLWEMKFKPGEYLVRNAGVGVEDFYDPNIDQILGQDDLAWQYNFFIDEPVAFQQERDKIYWLAVANIDPNNDGVIDVNDVMAAQAGANRFGWKTSRDHWNDDAVFIDIGNIFGLPVDAIGPPPGAPNPGLLWKDMRYPAGHPFAGESIDLAFVITPEPATLALLTLGTLAVLRRR